MRFPYPDPLQSAVNDTTTAPDTWSPDAILPGVADPSYNHYCDRAHRLTPPSSLWGRLLRWPWHWLNRRFLGMGTFAPFLREANRRQQRWQRAFWNSRA